MKAKDLRNLSVPELQKTLSELKVELRNLRFQHAINQLENPQRLKDVRHDIARVMTTLRSVEISGAE